MKCEPNGQCSSTKSFSPRLIFAGCAGEVMVVGREEGGEGRREKLETASLVAPDPDSSPLLA